MECIILAVAITGYVRDIKVILQEVKTLKVILSSHINQ